MATAGQQHPTFLLFGRAKHRRVSVGELALSSGVALLVWRLAFGVRAKRRVLRAAPCRSRTRRRPRPRFERRVGL